MDLIEQIDKFPRNIFRLIKRFTCLLESPNRLIHAQSLLLFFQRRKMVILSLFYLNFSFFLKITQKKNSIEKLQCFTDFDEFMVTRLFRVFLKQLHCLEILMIWKFFMSWFVHPKTCLKFLIMLIIRKHERKNI